jgi:hypothetical protein
MDTMGKFVLLLLRLSLLDGILCVEVFFWSLPVFSVCEEERRENEDRLAPQHLIIQPAHPLSERGWLVGFYIEHPFIHSHSKNGRSIKNKKLLGEV